MRYYARFYVFSLLTAITLADLATSLAPPWDQVDVKHASNTVPVDWVTLGDPPTGTTIDLHFSLKPSHEDALIDALDEVSNPLHPKYGAYLSKEQVAELVAPHPHALELVTSWLDYHDVPSSSISMTLGGGWLTVTDVRVSQANKLLGASYKLYRHTRTNDTTILRTVSYGLPAVLHKHVQTVVPTTCFASVRTLGKTSRTSKRSVGVRADAPASGDETASATAKSGGASTTGSSTGSAGSNGNKASKKPTKLSRRDQMVIPASLSWLHNYVPTPDQDRLGISSYLNGYPSEADLRTFIFKDRDDAMTSTFTIVRIDGGGYETIHPDTEVNIGIQEAQAVADTAPHIYHSTGGLMRLSPGSDELGMGDLFLEWLNHILSQPTIPHTISVSYSLLETNLSLEYMTVVCNLFAQLGARGVSVLFSSGDSGIGAGDRDDGSGNTRFVPEFPATCPYGTSVGGTTNKLPEAAASFSGGGFSLHFPRPSYQDEVVSNFPRNLGDQYAVLDNAAGRGVPDVTAQALRHLFIFNDDAVPANSTSCAVLTVAGVISLLNDHLISNGEPPLGFLNPWLYSYGPAGLNGAASDSNSGSQTDGFSAIAEWDPITGLGTPNFAKLQLILKRLVHSGHKPLDNKEIEKW